MRRAAPATGAALEANVAPVAERRARRERELKIWATELVYDAAPKVATARGVKHPLPLSCCVGR